MQQPLVGFSLGGRVQAGHFVPRSVVGWTETFENGLPEDLVTGQGGSEPVHFSETAGYGGGKCLLTTSDGGARSRWYFRGGPTGRFWATGDALFTWYVYLEPGTRQICNCAFWVNNAETSPVGFFFRVQSQSTDGGFHHFVGDSHVQMENVGNCGPFPVGRWYRVGVSIVGTVATGTVTDIATENIVDSQVSDLALHLNDNTGRMTGGTMGQSSDGLGDIDGIRIDNVSLVQRG